MLDGRCLDGVDTYVPGNCGAVDAHASGDRPATRAVYVDSDGVIRWRDSKQEVALFGANYCVMSGSDYRMAGLVTGDRKAMIDEDMAHFARMGWTALRLCSWGDWENATRPAISSSTNTSTCWTT